MVKKLRENALLLNLVFGIINITIGIFFSSELSKVNLALGVIAISLNLLYFIAFKVLEWLDRKIEEERDGRAN